MGDNRQAKATIQRRRPAARVPKGALHASRHRRRQLLDAEPAVERDGERAVDEVAIRLQDDNHAAEHFELLVASEAAVEEQDDAGVKHERGGELAKEAA